MWCVLCGESVFSLGKSRFTCRRCGRSQRCRKWPREKGCGWGSSRQLMSKPASWSKLPVLRASQSFGHFSGLWRNLLKKSKDKARKQNACTHHTCNPFVYSLISSKDSHWATGGGWMPGIINIKLVWKDRLDIRKVTRDANIGGLQMKPHCCWHLLDIAHWDGDRVTLGSVPIP